MDVCGLCRANAEETHSWKVWTQIEPSFDPDGIPWKTYGCLGAVEVCPVCAAALTSVAITGSTASHGVPGRVLNARSYTFGVIIDRPPKSDWIHQG